MNRPMVFSPETDLGVYEYSPEPDWNGVELLGYSVADGNGKSGTATIEFVVAPVNDAPNVPDLEQEISAGDTIAIDLNSVTSDPDGDLLSFALLATPLGADVDWKAAGVLAVTAKIGFKGTAAILYTVDDGNGGIVTATISVVVAGTADDLGVPELVAIVTATGSGDGSGPGEGEAELASLAFTGLDLVLGSVYETFGLFRLPFILFAATFGLSLLVGLGRDLSLLSGSVHLPMTRPERMASILVGAYGTLNARREPGRHAEVVYRFPARERDIRTTGSRARLGSGIWIELETPNGDAWVEAKFLTTEVPPDVFASDPLPQQLVERLRATIDADGDLRPLVIPRGLYIAYHAPPELIRADRLDTILAANVARSWWGRHEDHPDVTGSFATVIAHPLEASIDAYGARIDIDPSTSVPVELVNLHSLAITHPAIPGKDGWRISFDYSEGEARIFAVWREAAPNPAAVAPARPEEPRPGGSSHHPRVV